MPAPIPAVGVSEAVSKGPVKPRGRCPVCLHRWPLRADGNVQAHHGYPGFDQLPGGNCTGGGQRPRCKNCGGPTPGPDVGNWGDYCSGFCEMQDEDRI